MLFESNALGRPLPYLSFHFGRHRAEYYRLLDAVRDDGDREAWLDSLLDGVSETAQSAVDTAHRLPALFRDDALRVQEPGRTAANASRVFVRPAAGRSRPP